MTTLGTHNLLDGKAPATDFADIIFFTEAHPIVRPRGYRLYTCARQRDLSIAVGPGLFLSEGEEHYAQAIFGAKKVSPHRGTYWVTGHVNGEPTALLVEHRVNAAFPPYKRGEALFRRLAWWSHTRLTLKIIRRLKKKGYTIYAGGDLNTPVGVSGYKGVLNEVGRKYDRLGSTRELTDAKRLSPLGSDHFRLRATVK